jgi:hypothetical protein
MRGEIMAEFQESLVTEGMGTRKGVWSDGRRAPPIARSDIRRWAIATYWPEEPPRIYWDDEYAATTRYGSIIAPPDFNPFAWPVQRMRTPPGAAAAPDGRRLTSMNGGQTDTYGEPMRADDVITSRSRLRDWEERQGRNGLTLFVYNETEWRNQDDKLVRLRVSTGVQFEAGHKR